MLAYGTLVVDGRKKTMWFNPYDGNPSTAINNEMSDIALTDLDGEVVVTTIRHRSDLYRNGLREGDIILKVNGAAVSSSADVSLQKGTKIIAHDSRGFNKEVVL